MKNVLKISCVLFFLFFLNSCEKEEDNTFEPQLNESVLEGIEQESDTINYVYGSIIKIKDGIPDNSIVNKVVSNEPWIRLNREHLSKLSRNADINYLNKDDLLNRFTWAINKGSTRPKNVCINNEKFGEGHNPNNDYSWYTEMRPKPSLASQGGSDLTPFRRVKGTAARSERNRGDGRWMELPGEWRIETTNETNWHVTGSISTEIGGQAGIPFFKTSIKVTIGLEIGTGGSRSKRITEVIRDVGRIWVPAGKVANWELVERHRNYKSKWEVPLEFEGYVGADYGKKHEGHYFWAVSANKFFYEYTERDKKYIIDVNEEYAKELRVRAWVTDN